MSIHVIPDERTEKCLTRQFGEKHRFPDTAKTRLARVPGATTVAARTEKLSARVEVCPKPGAVYFE
jgi:hypothetical protein